MSLRCLETSTIYYAVTERRIPQEQNPRLITAKICRFSFIKIRLYSWPMYVIFTLFRSCLFTQYYVQCLQFALATDTGCFLKGVTSKRTCMLPLYRMVSPSSRVQTHVEKI